MNLSLLNLATFSGKELEPTLIEISSRSSGAHEKLNRVLFMDEVVDCSYVPLNVPFYCVFFLFWTYYIFVYSAKVLRLL